jgi:polyisoprenoid-binding protein YceI
MTTTKWNIDATHSEIEFKIKHLMISTVTGRFNRFAATVETTGNDFSTARVVFTADISSINTGNEQRDTHLRNNDFFDADNHPQLRFESSRMEPLDSDTFRLHGIFTMRGVSKAETFNVEYGGTVTDPWGNTRAGFTLSGKINRKDYGVAFSMVNETGGLLLGEEVKILAHVEFVMETVTEPVLA